MSNTEDRFLVGFLKTINTVYDFILLKKVGNIYIFGYDDNESFTIDIPKEGGDLDILYPENGVVIVDKNCVTPFTKDFMEERGGWDEKYEDEEWFLGHTAACKIFSDFVKVSR